MTLNHDVNNCIALDGNQSESTHSHGREPGKDFRKSKRINPDALDPDIITPAATSLEEEIDSEFYPGVYIP